MNTSESSSVVREKTIEPLFQYSKSTRMAIICFISFKAKILRGNYDVPSSRIPELETMFGAD